MHPSGPVIQLNQQGHTHGTFHQVQKKILKHTSYSMMEETFFLDYTFFSGIQG